MVNKVYPFSLNSGYNNVQFRGANNTSSGLKKLTYEEKVNKEEANIENIIERYKEQPKLRQTSRYFQLKDHPAENLNNIRKEQMAHTIL